MSQEPSGCLGAILRAFGIAGAKANTGGPGMPDTSVYRLRDDFLSPAEASFFRVLRQAVTDHYVVFSKVGLGDLFYVSRPHESRGAMNRIDRKHVDFLLCDPATLQPRIAIELDDSSHLTDASGERDRFKDDVFAAAGLRLVRMPARHAYPPEQLRALLLATGDEGPTERSARRAPVLAAEQTDAPAAPQCPKCEIPMELRTAGRGDNRGRQFWGCSNYPKCRQTVAHVKDW